MSDAACAKVHGEIVIGNDLTSRRCPYAEAFEINHSFSTVARERHVTTREILRHERVLECRYMNSIDQITPGLMMQSANFQNELPRLMQSAKSEASATGEATTRANAICDD